MIDLEFIKRCMGKEYQKFVKEFREYCHWKSNKCHRDDPNRHNFNVKKYSFTEKGKYSRSRSSYNRRKKFKSACSQISWEEKILIGRFYKNCPKGYEIDHIMPISRGGLHCLSNLQYLTKEENRRKGSKLIWNPQAV